MGGALLVDDADVGVLLVDDADMGGTLPVEGTDVGGALLREKSGACSRRSSL